MYEYDNSLSLHIRDCAGGSNGEHCVWNSETEEPTAPGSDNSCVPLALHTPFRNICNKGRRQFCTVTPTGEFASNNPHPSRLLRYRYS